MPLPPSRRAILGFGLLLLLPALAVFLPLRSAGVPDSAPNLHLHWVRHEPPLEPTWPDQPRFTSDVAFRPVVAGPVVLITSSRHDCVTALDSTGRVRWRFFTDAPVRFAPAVWEGQTYFTSDDGHLYCVNVSSGKLLWKFRGGPADRWVLGNERLISTWPARGAPVVALEDDGQATVYFAAGIWPFMGIFLYALDARTGDVRWQNSGDGSTFIKQPHNTDAFAGVAPQGSLVVIGDRLLVPGGRSIPACYDRHTGKRLHYRLAESSKRGGGPDVIAGAGVYVNGGGAFDLTTGDILGSVPEPCVFAGDTLLSVSRTTCRSFNVADRPALPVEKSKGKSRTRTVGDAWLGDPNGTATVPRTTTLLVAHGRLYGAGNGIVYAVDLPLRTDRSAVIWQAAIDGTAIHLAASTEQLFVSTREGRLYAFGPGEQKVSSYPLPSSPLPSAERSQINLARKVLDATGVQEGYTIVWGIGSGGLITELLRQTKLRLIVLDPDEKRVEEFREQTRTAGVDGKRLSVRCATPANANLPPYLASLVVCEDLAAAGIKADRDFFDRVFETLRPYGGVACFPLPGEKRETQSIESRGTISRRGDLVLIRREGALPGAADWTHEHADAANTRVSRDQRIKAPLGLLWFGGPGHQGILPRHGHGPVPQVCEGRLFIEGPNLIRAIDIYTGRLLWQKDLPGVGKAYDNTSHQPGANGIGSNYVSTPGGIFVAYRDGCLRLDPGTGKTLQKYQLPPLPGQKKSPAWTFLSVAGDYLVGGSGGVGPAANTPRKKSKFKPIGNAGSQKLTVLDRATGKILWSTQATAGFRHNGICLGNGRLFAIDRLAPPKEESKKAKEKTPGCVVAFDLATGKEVWRHDREVFGTWLSYSVKHNVLVEAGLMTRDTLGDEPAGMRVYHGSHGKVLWENMRYYGPAMIHGDRILKGGDSRGSSGTACELLTGKPIRTPDPLTGQLIDWRWVRTYGCNTPAASEHLVLFRSGAAGFYDMCNNSGTGNLGGFRSSCTLNLIPAGGVLTAPDYTRTCTCSYQNQTSLGLIHLPEAELWTFTTSRSVSGPIRQVGINLGAPGSRKADNHTLWLEYPVVGGPSPKLAIRSTPTRPETFRMHASQVSGDTAPAWVTASGVRGLKSLTIPLATDNKTPRRYTVRLYFLEPDELSPGQRLFDVALQGKVVLRRLDVCRQAGGRCRPVVHEFKGVVIPRNLSVTLTPCSDAAVPEPVLSGIEVQAEDG